MATPLVACSGCDRHVRSSEPACPFCGTKQEPVDLVRAPASRVAYRAAVVLAGAAALSACEKQPKQDSPINESSSGSVVAVYGPPPMMADANGPVPTPTPAPTPSASPGDAGKK